MCSSDLDGEHSTLNFLIMSRAGARHYHLPGHFVPKISDKKGKFAKKRIKLGKFLTKFDKIGIYIAKIFRWQPH